MTEAERGRRSSSAISPKYWPGPERGHLAVVAPHGGLALHDEEELTTDGALLAQQAAGWHLDLFERPLNGAQVLGRRGGEQPDLGQVEVVTAHGANSTPDPSYVLVCTPQRLRRRRPRVRPCAPAPPSRPGTTQTLPSPILPVAADDDDGVDDGLGPVVLDQHLDPDLGDEVDRVLGAAVVLGVPLLAAEALRLGQGHALHAHVLQDVLDVVELERLHHRNHELHRRTPHDPPGACALTEHVNDRAGRPPRAARTLRRRPGATPGLLRPARGEPKGATPGER